MNDNKENNNEMSPKETLNALKDILNILEERLPEKESPYKKYIKPLALLSALAISLFFLDFPDASRNKADLVVFDNTEVKIVKLTEANFSTKLPSNYLKVALLSENTSINSVFEISLYRNGLRYNHGAIRAKREESGTEIDLLSSMIINGDSKLVISPIGEPEGDYAALVNTTARSHGLRIGSTMIPLLKFLESPSYKGYLQIVIKPRPGTERFMSNIERFFGLLK